jgi:hypothetical protein
MRLWGWWRRDRISASLLHSYALEATKTGWDGPRWRTPKERAQMERLDRRKAMAVVPRRAAK